MITPSFSARLFRFYRVPKDDFEMEAYSYFPEIAKYTLLRFGQHAVERPLKNAIETGHANKIPNSKEMQSMKAKAKNGKKTGIYVVFSAI